MQANILNAILREYQMNRNKELVNAKKRKELVYSKIPSIYEIDRKIAELSISVSRLLITQSDYSSDSLSQVKQEIEVLRQSRAILLTENNLEPHYIDVKYKCNNCNDTGFLKSGAKCSCLKQKLINYYYKMSNLDLYLEKENFQTFNINVFSSKPSQGESMSPRENMLDIQSICEGFVFNFNNIDENLLFLGSTGTGKTFMCNCIAKALLDKGKLVIYQTAFKIIEILENYKFGKNGENMDRSQYSLLFDADLLIIDDLGTELTNSFTNTEIFNVVNTRLMSNKKIVISTNLSPLELTETYSSRFSSRLASDKFKQLYFYGHDLRLPRN